MLAYLIIFLYLLLLVVSLVMIYNRKTFDAKQKRLHSIISIIFPLWGILIGQFSTEPIPGSHFYPDKKNKYDSSPEQSVGSNGTSSDVW